MSTILPWGALLALSLAACSGSSDPLGPDETTNPSMDPGRTTGETHQLPPNPCFHGITAS
jgi:hypothetical protein